MDPLDVTREIGNGNALESPGRWDRRCRIYRKSLLLFLAPLILAGAAVLLVKARQDAVESRRCAKCQYQLKAIGLALLAYSDMHGSLPPAFLCDKNGRAVNSWRLLVADMAFYRRSVSLGYDVTQPPDSPSNSEYRVSDLIVEEFRCPSATELEPTITQYVVVTGPNTMWPGCEAAKLASNDSDKDKVLVIEIVDSDIRWTDPRDLTLEQALDAIQPDTGVGIGSYHPSGINYVTVGGEVRTLNRNIDRQSLRKLLVATSTSH